MILEGIDDIVLILILIAFALVLKVLRSIINLIMKNIIFIDNNPLQNFPVFNDINEHLECGMCLTRINEKVEFLCNHKFCGTIFDFSNMCFFIYRIKETKKYLLSFL